ncbi:MAG: chemotaxis protein CheX [Thermodesulfobacteriota bacterium]|nr:chemotaxis protein CheX [Thermodesulfobacteriota bacterium]
MEAKIINPFLEACINVLNTMAMLKPEPGKPYIKQDLLSYGDISGVIGLAGAKRGAVVVSFTEKCILKIVSSMLGENYSSIANEDVESAVGELVNMISGDARRQLAEEGLKIESGLPSVVVGHKHKISTKTTGPYLVMPFNLNGDNFVVEVSFED